MENKVKETLRVAIEQLFIRIHRDLLDEIYIEDDSPFDPSALIYDEKNQTHVMLVELCKKKLGYEPVATNQDVFFSIMKAYADFRKNTEIPASKRKGY